MIVLLPSDSLNKKRKKIQAGSEEDKSEVIIIIISSKGGFTEKTMHFTSFRNLIRDPRY